MMKIFSVFTFLCIALCMSAAAKADDASQRVCAASDLSGIYSLVDLQETPKADEAAWFQQYPYHYLIFYPNNVYAYIASRHGIAKAEDIQKSVKSISDDGSHELERKYTLDGTGLLNLYLEKKLDYSYRCMVVIKPINKQRPGDIVVTGYSKRRTELYKDFRHW